MADHDTSEEGYIFDSDQELTRLAKQHAVIKAAMGKLVLAPIDLSKGSLQILDSATSDGLWLRDLAGSLPSGTKHTYVGTDIMTRYFPKSHPADVTFAVQDINQVWPTEWKSRFDLVHQRLGLAGAGPAQKLAVARLIENVKPGSGYVQLIEADNVADPHDGPAMGEFFELICFVFEAMGVEALFSRNIRSWLEEVGMVDVQERVVDVFFGAKNPDPSLRQSSADGFMLGTNALLGFAKTMPNLPACFAGDKLDTFPSRLESELHERGGKYAMRVVWGRKPE